MSRGTAADTILYGRTGVRKRTLSDFDRQAEKIKNIRLGKRQKYTLAQVRAHSEHARLRIFLETRFKIAPGQAIDVIRSLADKGLIEHKSKSNQPLHWQLTTLGKEKLQSLQ